MRLEFEGTQAVDAPIRRVWDRLMDADFVASCAPGVEGVEPLDATHYKVKALLGVGSVRVRFSLHLELADLIAPERARMIIGGKAPGSAVQAESTVRLTPAEAATTLDWAVHSEVRGTIASTGARLLKGTVRKLTEQFWNTFAARVSSNGTQAANPDYADSTDYTDSHEARH